MINFALGFCGRGGRKFRIFAPRLNLPSCSIKRCVSTNLIKSIPQTESKSLSICLSMRVNNLRSVPPLPFFGASTFTRPQGPTALSLHPDFIPYLGQIRHINLSAQFTPVPLTFNRYTSETKPKTTEYPILIIPGLFGHKGNWTSLAKAMNKQFGNEVIVFDTRNHGESPRTQSMTYPEMAADIELFIEEQCSSDVILIGHSMGGKIAALLSLFRPDLVAKLVLEDVTPKPYGNDGSSSLDYIPRYIEGMLTVEWDLSTMDSLSTARKFANENLKIVVEDENTRQFLLTSLYQQSDDSVAWLMNLESIRENLPDIVGFPSTGELQYDKPTLVIGGGESTYIKPEDEGLFKKLFPHHKIFKIHGAGHWVHSEKPYDFLYLVSQFLKDK